MILDEDPSTASLPRNLDISELAALKAAHSPRILADTLAGTEHVEKGPTSMTELNHRWATEAED